MSYAGRLVPYGRPVRVATAFVPRLDELDAVVAEVAIAHYGRMPAKYANHLHFDQSPWGYALF